MNPNPRAYVSFGADADLTRRWRRASTYEYAASVLSRARWAWLGSGQVTQPILFGESPKSAPEIIKFLQLDPWRHRLPYGCSEKCGP